jgi:hypothetical protein
MLKIFASSVKSDFSEGFRGEVREADYLPIFCWDEAKIVSEPSQKGRCQKFGFEV